MLEVAILNVVPGKEAEFEVAFRTASVTISSMEGYISHQLQHCIKKQKPIYFARKLEVA